MICCDLSYPEGLHKEHESFPLAVHSMDITYEDLSPYSKSTLQMIREKPQIYKAKKLVGSFKPRKKYFCHSENLCYYLEKGLILEKIHSVLEFDQSPIIKPYVELTTRLRQEATSAFKKNIWKKFNNALYVRKYHNHGAGSTLQLYLFRGRQFKTHATISTQSSSPRERKLINSIIHLFTNHTSSLEKTWLSRMGGKSKSSSTNRS